MTYRAALQKLLIFVVATVMALACGRSDLTAYVWGDGGSDGGDGGACSPSTCPSGCCDPSGTCRDGTELNACGFGGGTCNDCQQEGFDFCDSQVKACAKIQPTCDVTTCGSGCCTTFNGQPACVSGASSLACGNSGAACVDCTQNGQVCDPSAKSCVNAPCGPNNCKGCCAGTTCVPTESDTQCGTGGLACTNCTAISEFCNQSTGNCVATPPLCGPSNCPTGCCAGDSCITSEADTQCGLGGLACTDCTAKSETCQSGVCGTTCTPKTCPGCCQTNTCFAGFIDTRCGSGGAACADCTATSTTCDLLTTPRVCKGTTTTCPATYGGCGSSVSTPVLSVTSGSCSSSDLADAKAACTGGFNSTACQSFFASEPSIHASCATCLASFQYALTDGQGLFNCVSPFVSSTCDHNTGCVDDCLTTSCDQCPPTSVQACKNSVATGQCSSYITAAQCIATALFGTATFCNPGTYGGNYGSWLAGVGKHYCE